MIEKFKEALERLAEFLEVSPGNVNARTMMVLEKRMNNFFRVLEKSMSRESVRSRTAYVKQVYDTYVVDTIELRNLIKLISSQSASDAASRVSKQVAKDITKAISEVIEVVELVKNQKEHFDSLTRLLTDFVPETMASVERAKKMDKAYVEWLNEFGHSYETRITATGILSKLTPFIPWANANGKDYKANLSILSTPKRLKTVAYKIKKIDPEFGGEISSALNRYDKAVQEYIDHFTGARNSGYNKDTIRNMEEAVRELDILTVSVAEYIDGLDEVEPDYTSTILKALEKHLS